ncbi:hypothetical protein [Rhizobium rhizophilum]|nr:hypothetical protein [Rhizobium rhizophilum]
MAYNPPVAVYDACVPYPFHLSNVISSASSTVSSRLSWTNDIQDEWMRP